MICEACTSAASLLYKNERGRLLCHHCFRDLVGREPTDEEKVTGEQNWKGRHFCDTCTWGRFQGVVIQGGYDGLCCVNSIRRMIRKDDFCGEHPEALRDRQALMSPTLDPSAFLSVAVGQFMGNYFSQALKKDEVGSTEEDELTLGEIAEAIVEHIITDMHLNMEEVSSAWTAMGTEKQEEARRRWFELVVDRL